MRSKLFSSLYALNIVFQGLFNLVTPAALLFIISYLLISKVGAPEWIYAITLPIGIFLGLYSMVKFILAAMKALDRLEEQGKKTKNTKTENGNKNE